MFWSVFFKIASLRPVISLKIRLRHRRFPVNFTKVLRALPFIEHVRVTASHHRKPQKILSMIWTCTETKIRFHKSCGVAINHYGTTVQKKQIHRFISVFQELTNLTITITCFAIDVPFWQIQNFAPNNIFYSKQWLGRP